MNNPNKKLKVYKFDDSEQHWMIADNINDAFSLYNEYVCDYSPE